MTRGTSIQAFAEIAANGWLPASREAALRAVVYAGPGTAREIAAYADPATARDITPRLAELRERGYVVEAGRRACRVTGKEAIVWACADPMPTGVVRVKREARRRFVGWMELDRGDRPLKDREGRFYVYDEEPDGSVLSAFVEVEIVERRDR